MGANEKFLRKKYGSVPPDGGWGYMIWLSVSIFNVNYMSLIPCFGVIFNELFLELDLGSTSVGVLNGINALAIAISGYATGPLLKVMSLRKTAFLGASLYSIGLIGNIFVRSEFGFYVSQGVLVGTGTGFLLNATTTILNQYFSKKLLLSYSLTQLVTATASIVSPLFVQWAQNKFGYGGTIVLLAALSLQNFVAVSLMQPVKWHSKFLKVDVEENQTACKEDDKNIILERIESKDGGHNKCLQVLGTIFDWSLLKDLDVMNLCLGIAFCIFADFYFALVLPQALYAWDWNEESVAWAISLIGIGDFLTKIFMGIFSKKIAAVPSRIIFMIGIGVSVVSRIGVLWSPSTLIIQACFPIVGLSHGLMALTYGMVFSDAVPQHQFANALGMMMLFFGLFNLVLGSLIGAVRDMTGSHVLVFYILVACFAITFISWTLELTYKRLKLKKTQKNNNLAR